MKDPHMRVHSHIPMYVREFISRPHNMLTCLLVSLFSDVINYIGCLQAAVLWATCHVSKNAFDGPTRSALDRLRLESRSLFRCVFFLYFCFYSIFWQQFTDLEVNCSSHVLATLKSERLITFEQVGGRRCVSSLIRVPSTEPLSLFFRFLFSSFLLLLSPRFLEDNACYLFG